MTPFSAIVALISPKRAAAKNWKRRGLKKRSHEPTLT
jgi:hypothetical protein